jgi:hypothetical protein
VSLRHDDHQYWGSGHVPHVAQDYRVRGRGKDHGLLQALGFSELGCSSDLRKKPFHTPRARGNGDPFARGGAGLRSLHQAIASGLIALALPIPHLAEAQVTSTQGPISLCGGIVDSRTVLMSKLFLRVIRPRHSLSAPPLRMQLPPAGESACNPN